VVVLVVVVLGLGLPRIVKVTTGMRSQKDVSKPRRAAVMGFLSNLDKNE